MRDRFSAQPAREGRFAALKRLVPAESPVIVDGGAYKGEMIDIFLSQYAAPVIHAFEANPRRAAKLRRKYTGRRNVRVHERALGAFDGPVDFHILAAEPLSSAFTPKDFRETPPGIRNEGCSAGRRKPGAPRWDSGRGRRHSEAGPPGL